MKLGSLEAHLKVWRAWDADFWSNRRWAMCLWDGIAMDDDDADDDDNEEDDDADDDDNEEDDDDMFLRKHLKHKI